MAVTRAWLVACHQLLFAGASEEAEGEIYNLGGDEPISLAELAEELIAQTGCGSVRAVPFPPERQIIDIGNVYSSYRKIETAAVHERPSRRNVP